MNAQEAYNIAVLKNLVTEDQVREEILKSVAAGRFNIAMEGCINEAIITNLKQDGYRIQPRYAFRPTPQIYISWD